MVAELAQNTGMSRVHTDAILSFCPNSEEVARKEAGEGSGHSTQASR